LQNHNYTEYCNSDELFYKTRLVKMCKSCNSFMELCNTSGNLKTKLCIVETYSNLSKYEELFHFLDYRIFFSGMCTKFSNRRNQLSLVKESDLQLMATSQYNTFLTENKVLNPNNSKDAAMVDRIGARIANAVTKYYKAREKNLCWKDMPGNLIR